MVGWHHQLDRYEFEQAPVVGEGQRRLSAEELIRWNCGAGKDF